MNLPVKREVARYLGPLFNPLYLFYLSVEDIKSWRYFPKWFSSFRPAHSLLSDQALDTFRCGYLAGALPTAQYESLRIWLRRVHDFSV
jgi:hypothetical protein